MSGKLTIGNILNTLGNVLFALVLSILTLLTVVILLLQTVTFQNFLVEKILTRLNKDLVEEVSFSRIKVKWFDSIVLKGVELTDYRDNQMARLGYLNVNFDLVRIIKSGNIKVSQLELSDVDVNLRKYDDSLNINLIEFVNRFESKKEPKHKKDSIKKVSRYTLSYAYMENVVISYINDQKDGAQPGRIDFANIDLKLDQGIFDDISLVGDSINFQIGSFKAQERNSGLTINDWQTQITFTPQSLFLDDLSLSVNDSYLGEQVHLMYSDLKDFGNFMQAINMDLRLKKTRINPRDLKYFADINSELPIVEFDGRVSGTVSALSVRDMVLKARKRTQLKGSADMFGLPNIDETFIDLSITDGDVWTEDFNDLLNDLPAQTGVKHLSLKGNFSGFLSDFVAKVDVQTGQGSLVSDLNLKLPKNWEDAQYSGNLKVTNFNAGAFLNDKRLVQNVNFQGFIKGSGLTIDNANFYTEGELKDAGIYGYQYQSIKAKGEFASSYFNGSLRVIDPNLLLDVDGTVNLASKPEKIQIKSNVKKANFYQLGLASEDYRLSTKIDLVLNGLNIDSLTSNTRIENTIISHKEKELLVDSVIFTTQNTGLGRDILFAVPNFQGRIYGDFYYSQLTQDLAAFAKDLSTYFDPTVGRDSLYQPNEGSDYKVKFDLKYGDLNEYIRFFTRRLYVSPKGTVSGEFLQRKNATISFFAEVDSVNFEGIGFNDNSVDVNISMDHASKGILGMAYFNSRDQYWRAIPNSSDLAVEAVWENDHLDVNTTIEQEETNSRASVNLGIDFYEHSLAFEFRPSVLTILGDEWSFSRHNRIEYDGATTIIDQLELSQNEQVIALSGVYSDSLTTDVSLFVRNFQMPNLNTVLPVHLEGVFDGDVDIYREIGDTTNLIRGDINIGELYVDDIFVGDINGESEWSDELGRLSIDFAIKRESINTIVLAGDFYPDRREDQLDMKLNFDQANLILLSPIVTGTLSNVSGTADGEITIKGIATSPLLKGFCRVSDAKFTYDYLGVTYIANGRLNVDNESIVIDYLLLRDKDNNLARVKGQIDHTGFENIRPNITLDTRRFLFLNTPSTTEELYYGTAYASGSVGVLGSLDDLLIEAKIRSEKGTKVYMPLEEEGQVEHKEYILFRNFQDTTSKSEVEDVIKKSISGVRLDFDMEVTPDAYVELIFDKRAGDIIKGSANGNLNLVLDTNGEFELFGDVSITEGAYNFTSSIKGRTFLSKEFSVEPGSTITWYGDPFAGILNLRAIYRQMASLSDYRRTTDEGADSQRLPVLVVLALKGEMFSPSISFEIRLDDTQSLASNQDKAEISAINSNEQDLKTQVFSLLMMKKFTPKGDFSVQGGNTAVSSLSEFVSNQLSYYASQFNENLEVDLDVNSMDNNALNAQLRLSYTFLDGRLKVSGAGGFNQNSTSNQVNNGNDNSFIGDWSVRYLLTSDGRLRLRAFSQSEQVAGVQQRETGVSLQMINSFDDLRELLKTSKIRDLIRRREEESESEEEAL
ncbi:translocation/assembly module TamB [Marinoscillum sp. MHG1-6]|uniref:translocation/assembly module TamB domain-containing protein n=1 Tax=Marinoscillum sp. MHG1-6 TaxID=2959627 RepID=UPI002157B80F|nr:translocation/assembly module TamB [Marinoscillum sp. MHG1-6]